MGTILGLVSSMQLEQILACSLQKAVALTLYLCCDNLDNRVADQRHAPGLLL